MSRTRIAFSDDHPTLLKGMEALFSDDDKFEIVATSATADEAVGCVAEKRPDILVIDLSMPGDVYAAITKIARDYDKTKVIVFTAYANVAFALRAFDAGARAFVLKGRPVSDLNEAIAAVGAGELFVSPGFSDRLISDVQNRSARARPVTKLSRREAQIVEGLLKGETNREIAASLGLAEKTVKHYMTNLMNKLKVKSRVAVVLAAQERRLVHDGTPRAVGDDELLIDP
jgi:DNA-binding NarL/FixJ family response regulator